MCRPNASIDDVIDHLEHRQIKLRQSISVMRLNAQSGINVSVQTMNIQTSLQDIMSGKMLPVIDMK